MPKMPRALTALPLPSVALLQNICMSLNTTERLDTVEVQEPYSAQKIHSVKLTG